MKKIIVFAAVLVFCFEADARYVRKTIEPDFFIPSEDRMHRPEKLPPLNKLFSDKKTKKYSAKIPAYKQKYSQYLSSMAVFASTGSFLVDKDFDADMAAFEDGKVFEVEQQPAAVPAEMLSEEQRNFYDMVDAIIKN